MGYTEFAVVLCFVVTIWSNTANAEIDCRKFVFAPSCRGVSAKRSWSITNHKSDGLKEDDVSEEQQKVLTDNGVEPLINMKFRSHKKRFDDLLKTSLLRRTRSKDLNELRALLSPYASFDEIFASNDDD